jgi:hypothetical protein
MELYCENCQSKLRVADEKMRAGQTVSITCPKCGKKIAVKASSDASGAAAAPAARTDIGGDYDASEKPFDFIEEEGKTALLCETDSKAHRAVMADLQLMEYQITEAQTARDALKKMRYHTYDLVVVHEAFDASGPDQNGVLIYLERLPMITRRNIFVVMLSDEFRTMDNMMAFRYSVNIVINRKNSDDFARILSSSIADNEIFYRVYKEALKASGMI